MSDAWQHETDCREHLEESDHAGPRSTDILGPRGTGLQSCHRHQKMRGTRGEEERREQPLQNPEHDIHVTHPRADSLPSLGWRHSSDRDGELAALAGGEVLKGLTRVL